MIINSLNTLAEFEKSRGQFNEENTIVAFTCVIYRGTKLDLYSKCQDLIKQYSTMEFYMYILSQYKRHCKLQL